MEICKHSYIRQDPYFFRCVKCGDTVPAEQDEDIEALHNKIDELQARIEALIVALEIIAGKRQCTDNTMSNVEIALAALLDSEPSAHTCNASCQRPACVLRRRVEGAVVTPPILRIEK